MIKSIAKLFIYGIAGGCILFVVWIIVMETTGSERLHEILGNFTINALGFAGMATGFSVSSIVYDFERLSMWLKISINVFVGFGILFFVGHSIDIIPLNSPGIILIVVVIAIVLFIAAHFIDYLFSGREAKKINAKLREADKE